MKKWSLLLVLFIPFVVVGQNFVMTWQQCYGGTNDDKVTSIIPYNGGYLFWGNTKSTDGDISTNSCDGAAWLVNINNKGSILFEKTFCGFGGASGFKIILNEDNGHYLIGSSGPNSNGINGYWLSKIDDNFDIIWQNVYGGSSIENPRGGCLSHDGGIIEIGLTGSNDGDIEEHFGVFDNWAVKLSNTGSKEWVKTYANVGAEEGGEIIPTSDGGYIITACGDNYLPGNIYCEDHNQKDIEAWLIKTNSFGEIVWNQCYGGSKIDLIQNVIELEDGYLAVGSSESNDFDLPGNNGYEAALDIWVIKTDLYGNLIWSRNFGGSDWDYSKHILKNSDGSFTIFGFTKSKNYDVQGNTNTLNSYVVWMFKINEEGELIYQKPFGELEGLLDFPDFIRISDYKYIAAVTKRKFGCNHTWGNHNEDIYVFEIQDMDEFIPSQAYGLDQICLGIETESYYTTELVNDTMETQWLLLPEEAGEITALHDSVLISWNADFQDTAWLQVRAVNEYGESAYSTPKEIIVYSPLIIADIIGPDSICSATNTQTIFSTIITEETEEINWYLQPETAGTINNQQDTAIIIWSPSFEGQVSLKIGILNNCDTEVYSNSKVVQVRTCLGLSNQQTKELKFYPNPASNQITFELPAITKESLLQIKDLYGKLIIELPLKANQSKLICNCNGLATGVYFYQTEISGEVYRGKILVN